ncbi:MAG: glycosyltransferase family 2 protein [Bacteroidetes Order II. Incertae sedis bacterium]|nr:glycosyltransferase family 2 protein [Bacteroidetes Order II. bacterium]
MNKDFKEWPGVSIIILNWNGQTLMETCLPAVLQTDYPAFEVVVVDNASTDDSLSWLLRTYPDVKIIGNPENWGYARGNNVAIYQTEKPFLVLLNNDVEVHPQWLREMMVVMRQSPDIAAVQPKLLHFHNRGQFEYAGAAGGHLDDLGIPFTRGRILSFMEEDRGQYNDISEIFWASGAALLLRRAALAQSGLLDEAFYMHMEEIDLCWRLKRSGFRIMVAPKGEVYHIGGASLPQGSPRKLYYNFRNSLLMLYKNLPKSRFYLIYPFRLFQDTLAFFRLLFSSHIEAMAVWRAHRDFLNLRRNYSPPSPSESIVLPSLRGSVLWDAFIRRRQTFASIPKSHFRR